MTISGRARVLGDDVNTDYIISSSRKRVTIDPKLLAPYLFENHAPGLAASIAPGDVLVAGRNFGCGSAMEVAVTVIQAAGISAVVATSFARSFFRNAINNGLPVVMCETPLTSIGEGDRVTISIEGIPLVRNASRDATIQGAPLPSVVLDLLEHGGLVRYLAARPSSWATSSRRS